MATHLQLAMQCCCDPCAKGDACIGIGGTVREIQIVFPTLFTGGCCTWLNGTTSIYPFVLRSDEADLDGNHTACNYFWQISHEGCEVSTVWLHIEDSGLAYLAVGDVIVSDIALGHVYASAGHPFIADGPFDLASFCGGGNVTMTSQAITLDCTTDDGTTFIAKLLP